ncbi:MAG TPA: MCP four helix bundle domain-containing protein [Methylorubrum populi]|uniref:MCP four helix bundle domain-containing protein n=1 Tax=Methylorubrum populi TaxID=223967 RepID=A0A921E5Q3_9HYPH|nr:MCP four helix bundle domain-containing protein [Methylorubrum populi]
MSLPILTIRTKLASSFLVLILFIAGISIFGIHAAGSINDRLLDVGDTRMPKIRTISQIDALTGRYTTSLLRHMLTAEPKMLAGVEADLADRRTKLDRLKTLYEPLIDAPDERGLYDSFVRDWDRFIATAEPLLALSRQGAKAEALQHYETQAVPPRRRASDTLAKIVELNETNAARAVRESQGTYTWTRAALIAAGTSAAFLACLLALLIVRGVTTGIASVVRPMQALASGELGVAIPHRGLRTEIGAIADAVQVFKDGLLRMKALEEETAQARLAAAEQRKAAMRQMADGFEAAVGGVIAAVNSAASVLQGSARTMADTASRTASQSTNVAAAAEQAASNVNTVAAAAEELGASVEEIGRQVDGSASLAQQVVAEADQTGHLVQKLSGAVSRIDEIVAMISGIASQTNLLALNATIEAARAGEAGRGFAVVAAEVKELATQTARATQDISEQIGQIHGSTGQAVEAIDAITLRIKEISDVSTNIAAAVEEQGAATQEIVRNVTHASAGTTEVTGSIADVAQASEETGAAASQVLAAASELSHQSACLSSEVERFLTTVRAA